MSSIKTGNGLLCEKCEIFIIHIIMFPLICADCFMPLGTHCKPTTVPNDTHGRWKINIVN